MSILEKEQLLEQISLIIDVDGVVREGIDSIADPQIIRVLKKLLKHQGVHMTFLSGTPVFNKANIEPWRQGNLPLMDVFSNAFDEEIAQKKVSIYGMLGGHKMKEGGSFELLDFYPLNTSFELARVLLDTFLQEISLCAPIKQKNLARTLRKQLHALPLPSTQQAIEMTPKEFAPIAEGIRKEIDPQFRLIANGTTVETHVSLLPYYKAEQCVKSTEQALDKLKIPTPHIASGIAKKAGQEFYFLLLSKTHKGVTAQQVIDEHKRLYPHALVISIGDSQIDFPMHACADLAFHVGPESVEQAHPLPHCILVLNEKGEDEQHVHGAFKIFSLLEEGMHKPLRDLACIPHRDPQSGRWCYSSYQKLKDLSK